MYAIQSEDVASGYPGCINPLNVTFSPDGGQLCYLFPDKSGKRQVFSLNLDAIDCPRELFATKSSTPLSIEEELRRERMRLFADGIACFEWAPRPAGDLQRMVVSVGQELVIFEQSTGSALGYCTVVYDGSLGAAIDPHLSEDGSALAFVINNDLYMLRLLDTYSGIERDTRSPIRLTTEGGKDGISCGVADFVAQEEMDRYRGFWWSPDTNKMAFTINNESHIPEYEIIHHGDDPHTKEAHRYPFAGQANPSVQLAVMDLSTQNRIIVDLFDAADVRFHGPQGPECYTARVGWWADGSLMVQVENRLQNVLQVLRVDSVTGQRTVLVEETSSVWINLHDLLHVFKPSFRLETASHSHKEGDFYFLWGSERSGYRHLYLYKYCASTGKGICLSGPIDGDEEGMVSAINAVDEDKLLVYFTSNEGDCTQSHLFRVPLCPSSSAQPAVPMRLTTTAGHHNCTVLPARNLIADIFSSLEVPVKFDLYRLQEDGEELVPVLALSNSLTADKRFASNPLLLPALRPPTLYTIRSADGLVDLKCAAYLPLSLSSDALVHGHEQAGSAPLVPAVVSVYGGPHVQRVLNQWALTADLRAQRMAQEGFLVIKCDNRGSSNRGIAFEGALQHNMGEIEVLDQQTAVQHLIALGLVDAKRVGMFGWSYGGYMSAMSLCRAPTTFRCAVAGAPVTSWDGYDTHYTERYMGLPQDNSTGYTSSSVMTHVEQMTGRLMLLHGLVDENVHFRHTARLITSLTRARKAYDLVVFPGERHSPHRLQDRVYMEDIIHEFFVKNLAHL